MKQLEGFEEDVESNELADEIRKLERYIRQSTQTVPQSKHKVIRKPSNHVPLNDIPFTRKRR